VAIGLPSTCHYASVPLYGLPTSSIETPGHTLFCSGPGTGPRVGIVIAGLALAGLVMLFGRRTSN